MSAYGNYSISGNCWIEVVKTGEHTRFGKMAEKLAAIKEDESPLAKKLAQLSKIMLVMGVVAAVAVTLLMIGDGRGLVQGMLTGVSLAVAVIPEGLPAVLSITLALGLQRMAKKSDCEKVGGGRSLGADDGDCNG